MLDQTLSVASQTNTEGKSRPVGSPDKEFAELYRELRTLAARHLSNRRSSDTLQPTVLVHEAYLRLSGSAFCANDRTHLLCAASTAMRHVLVDYVRARQASRRGGQYQRVFLEHADAAIGAAPLDVLFLHEALTRLAQWDERQAKGVELRFFVGLTLDEIANVLGISAKTAKRDWAMARAWLQQELKSLGGS